MFSFVIVLVVQIGRMCMFVFEPLVTVYVRMRAVYQWAALPAVVCVVFVWVRMTVIVDHRLVDVIMGMVFSNHQPGSYHHDRQGSPEQDLWLFAQ